MPYADRYLNDQPKLISNHSVRIEKDDRLVIIRQQLRRAGSVPPVPHEISGNGEHRQDVYTSSTHAVIRIIRNAFVESA